MRDPRLDRGRLDELISRADSQLELLEDLRVRAAQADTRPRAARRWLRAKRHGGVIFDVDGTLLDTNYLHVVAWWEAFTRTRPRHAAVPTSTGPSGMGSAEDWWIRVLGDPDPSVNAAHSRHIRAVPRPDAPAARGGRPAPYDREARAGRGARDQRQRRRGGPDAGRAGRPLSVLDAVVSSGDVEPGQAATRSIVTKALDESGADPRTDRHGRRHGLGCARRGTRRHRVHRPALRWYRRGAAARPPVPQRRIATPPRCSATFTPAQSASSGRVNAGSLGEKAPGRQPARRAPLRRCGARSRWIGHGRRRASRARSPAGLRKAPPRALLRWSIAGAGRLIQ